MFRPSSSSRFARQAARTTQTNFRPNSRRFLTTEPPHKTSRSWKNSATRWTIAIAGIYWYNTTPLFAEQPQLQDTELPLPTLDSLSRANRFSLPSDQDVPTLPVNPNTNSPPSLDPKSPLPSSPEQEPTTQSPSDLEAEASSQGAFNEETGEINWDCPCLGGMAHGPCGPEFREAFSCFVFSKEEPKGMECVDKFKGMQTCFREHPEEYGDQLEDDEDDVERELAEREVNGKGSNIGAGEDGVASAVSQGVATALKEEVGLDAAASGVGGDASKALPKDSEKKNTGESIPRKSIYDSDSDNKATSTKSSGVVSSKVSDATKESTSGSNNIAKGVAGDEGGDLVPKASHDAR